MASTLQLLLQNFVGGGAVFIFGEKIGLKSTKNVLFCILFRPMGGSSPSAPSVYATVWYIYYNRRLGVISFIAWNVSTTHLLSFPQVTTFDLCLLIKSEQIISGRGWLQNSSTRFIKSCGLAVRTLNITKLRTCGCELQKLQSCVVAVANFKNYEVADSRILKRRCGLAVAD